MKRPWFNGRNVSVKTEKTLQNKRAGKWDSILTNPDGEKGRSITLGLDTKVRVLVLQGFLKLTLPTLWI